MYTSTMQDAKEEVRARLNIEDVVGEYVQLKRSGRNYKGLSPFSGEKTPSFFVSPDKNIWHDFSSNKGGDIFSFIMEVEGMDFRQALEHLARKAGVELADFESSTAKKRAARKKRALEINALAARYYQQSLLRNQGAMEYVFTNRKLNKRVVQDFQIGYAPDTGHALVRALTKKGFTKHDMADAGVVNRFGGDMFRARMMVPLMDAAGGVIGFTGRIIDDNPHAPKYLNTAQSILYDKGRHIFGLSQAKESIRTHGYVVVVEGNLDVVSSHQAGVRQVVATAGTAMTEHHLRALKRLTSDVRLSYDGDKAGIAATERAILLAAQIELELTIISMPEGAKDPDELIKKNPALWQQAIDTAIPAVEWILRQYAMRVNMKTVAGKRAFTTAGLTVVRLLNDPVEQEFYEKKIAAMAGSSLESVREKMTQKSSPRQPLKPMKVQYEPEKVTYVYEDDLLALAAIDAACREQLVGVEIAWFHGDERKLLAEYCKKHNTIPLESGAEELQKIDTYVKIVLLRAEERYATFDSNERYYEAARLVRQIKHEHNKKRKSQLVTELRDAEVNGDESKANDLREQLNVLIKETTSGK